MHFLIGLAKKMVAYGLLLWVILTYYYLREKKSTFLVQIS